MATDFLTVTDKPLTATGVKNRMIAKLLEQGASSEPIASHWQGANRIAQSLLGGYQLREADKEEKTNQAAQTQAIAALLGGGAPAPAQGQPAMPPVTPQMAPQAPPRPPVPPQNVSGPVPPDDPTMTVSPRQVAEANPGLTSGPRPPTAMYQPAAAPAPQAPAAPAAPPQAPMPATSSAAPPDMQARVQAMLQDPNPAVRQMGKQLASQLLSQRMKPNQLKSVVIGDRGFVFDERTGQWTPGPDATKKTDDERNLAAENQARAARGEQPLSLIQFEQARKAATAQGTVQGETAAMLPAAESRAERAIQGIAEIRNHPGRLHGVSSNAAGLLQGTPQYDFKRRVDQLKGGAFLEAFQMLKGGGAVTEAEGTKASIAMERMDRALSRKDFDAALDDYQAAVRDGLAKLKLKARGESNLAGQTARAGANNDPLGLR